jgi:hypothetical protein
VTRPLPTRSMGIRALASGCEANPRILRAVAKMASTSGRPLEVQLHGRSMTGTLPDGCKITITCGAGPYRRGDIVAALWGSRIVVHRVTHAFRRGVLLTRGDAMTVPDPPVAADVVIGRIDSVLTSDGWKPPAPVRRVSRGSLLSFLMAACAAIHPRVAVGFRRVLLLMELRQ